MQNRAASDGTMPFIITTPSLRTVKEKRKLIRSHVMWGKNLKKRPQTLASCILDARLGREHEVTQEIPLFIPDRVGDEFSLTHWSTEMTTTTLEIIRKCESDPVNHEFASDLWLANNL